MSLMILVLFAGCNQDTGSNQTVSQQTSSAAYIENKGSDTMVNLALAWAERYQEIHPGMRLSVTGGGSGTGLAALIKRNS